MYGKILKLSFLSIASFWLFAGLLHAQGTEFTYQGRLLSSAGPASGSHDFEFLLWDASEGGTQLGQTVALTSINVNNGVFSVRLDFGNQFPGANRYLEIRVRQTGNESYTMLAPRQAITSSPYAIKSLSAQMANTALSADQLGGISPNEVVLNTDPRLFDPRDPAPNSGNYIQNRSTTQTASNFNISGTGTANVISAMTQFNLGASRVLSGPGTNNLFAGTNAGASHTSGLNLSFFGVGAGSANTIGSHNSFFGTSAGSKTTVGHDNAFFGSHAGAVSTGVRNSFFGSSAGTANSTGNDNSFYGQAAGLMNTTGSRNSFFGTNAGARNTTANGNAFYGFSAGTNNSTGFSNSFFGTNAGSDNTTGNHNSFFGSNAGQKLTGSDNSFFGSEAGANSAQTANNSFFGSSAGFANSTGNHNSFYGQSAGLTNSSGSGNSFFGLNAGSSNVTGQNNSVFGLLANVGLPGLENAVAIGARSLVGQSNSLVLGSIRNINGCSTSIGCDTVRVGIGTTTPGYRLTVGQGANSVVTTPQIAVFGAGNSYVTIRDTANNIEGLFGADPSVAGGSNGTTIFGSMTNHSLSLRTGNSTRMVISTTGNVGVNTVNPLTRFHVNGNSIVAGSLTVGASVPSVATLDVYGTIAFSGLGTAGTLQLCRNGSNIISQCSSSLRYKSNVSDLTAGLSWINRLRPVSFNWRSDNTSDLGLVAEEVAEVEPLLAIRNEKGEIEGVKYDRIGVVLINAVNEQQVQIESQQQEIEKQNQQIIEQDTQIKDLRTTLQEQRILIESLRLLVCQQNREAQICLEENKK